MVGPGVGRVFGGGGGGGPSLIFSNSSQSHEPFFISGSSNSSSFLGSSSMMSFEDVCGGKRSERPFFYTYDQEENNGEEDFEDYFHQPEKKRRLTLEQVQFLEKSFEVENKLEPERKVQLAKELGLQPRQVAIWFQNRRARWKTKQLEKDFKFLQSSYNSLKADYETLLEEKHKLQAEVVHLTDKLFLKDKTQDNHSEPSNTYIDQQTNQEELITESGSETEDPRLSVFTYKQDDLSSTIDSDSPQYLNVSNAFEAYQSDISQDDDDNDNDNNYLNSSFGDVNFGFTCEDHASLFFPYWDNNIKM